MTGMKLVGFRALAASAAAAVCVLCVAAAAPARAETVAEFYAGKTVTIHVGFSPGGGYDLYARVLAPHLARYIPGKPSVIVKNLPGAGSLKLAIYMHTVAPRNGTEIATITRGAPVENMLGETKVNFDPAAANWIGSMNDEASICVVNSKTGVKSIEDMRTRELSFGTQGKGSDSELFAVFLRNLLGVKAKIITGYPGTNESILAMERGEVDGNCGWSWSTASQARPDWFKSNTVNIVLQFAMKRHADLKNVPLLLDLAKTDAERAQVELVVSRQVMGRPYVAPPGVPADRVTALRKAFMDAMADPEFKAAADRAKLEINPVSGQDVQTLVERLLKTPADVVAATRRNIGG